MDDLTGRTIGHYRVLQALGQGAMGEVYLAEDQRLHRPVALKLLRAQSGSDEARERLLREARAASALNHPNIAVIYEIDEADQDGAPLRYLAMEYVAGKTLADMARRGDLTLDTVLDMVWQIADALSEAHSRGIVHRDVKPSNVMVTESGRVKVLDFGLAKQQPFVSDVAATWSRGMHRSEDAAIIGTVAYMAPEQALGHEIDGRADVFSLGVLLYEVLSGRLPFGGEHPIRVLDAILHSEAPPLVARFSDPRIVHVEAVVRRMLAKDRDLRYASMREVCDELDALRRGVAPRTAVRASARVLAVMAFENISRNGEDDWLGTGIAETLTSDLKGVEGLTVVTRERVHEITRTLTASGSEADLPVRVGRAVGAQWVLVGGFQRSGDALRVTGRLTEVDSGTVVRTLKVDGRLGDIFVLQDRLVQELSGALRLTLTAGDSGPDETTVVEAYEALTKGVLNVRVESHEALDRAAYLFERAVRLDPTYARAHLELGSAWANKAEYLTLPELHERALASIRRAIELRPGFVRAWRELGWVLVALGREDEGIEAIQRALELDAEDAGALGAMARAYFVGKAEFRRAAGFFERALARNPQGGWYALQLAHCYALLGDYAPGEATAARAVELQEASLSGQEKVRIIGAYMRRGHLAALQQRFGEAVEQFQRELAFLQRIDHALRSRIIIELHMRLGAAHRRLGDTEPAAAALEVARNAFEQRTRLGADEPFTRYYAACVYALCGQTEEALACLEKAARMRPRFTIARARTEPELESLRDEPRMRALLD
jgi:serine/threonine protein kinase/tetratricopeptide (TPR) repeat protein